MVPIAHIELAHKFLVDADEELNAGEVFQASEKLWGAASHVVIAEMHRQGIKQSGHKAMVNAVETIADDVKDPRLGDLFASAEALHANFYHGFMDADDVRRYRNRVHVFVNRFLEFTEGRNGAPN